jgi:hypothetical protein
MSCNYYTILLGKMFFSNRRKVGLVALSCFKVPRMRAEPQLLGVGKNERVDA